MDGANNSTVEDAYGLDFYLPRYEIGIFWCAFLALEAIWITVLNFLTIVTFMINSHLQKRSSYCIVNLAVADFLVGAVSVPMNVYVLGLIYAFWGDNWSFLDVIFYAQNTFYVFTGMASLFSLVLISLERVLATVYPLQHRTTSTLTYVLGVGVTWLLSAVVAAVWICSLIYFKQLQVALYLWMTSLLVSILVICAAYVGVYIAVKLHNNKQQNSMMNRSLKREKELALTLFIVAAISLACWIPFAVVQVLNFKNDTSLSLNTIYAANAIANANSFINPLVYVFRMQGFRCALSQLITKCHRDRQRRKSLTLSQSVTDGLISRRRITRA